MPTSLQKSSKKTKAGRLKEVHQVFSLVDIEYFKHNQKMVIYLRKYPEMKEIFNAYRWRK